MVDGATEVAEHVNELTCSIGHLFTLHAEFIQPVQQKKGSLMLSGDGVEGKAFILYELF